MGRILCGKLKRNGFGLNRPFALACCLSAILSENRFPPTDQVRGQAFRDHALAPNSAEIGGQEIGGQSCPITTRLLLVLGRPGRPWRGDWSPPARRSRSSNASCLAAHA